MTQLVETPDAYGAYRRLSAEQIEALAPYGERAATTPGQLLFREGDAQSDFFVILEGKVAIVERYEDEERVISVRHLYWDLKSTPWRTRRN